MNLLPHVNRQLSGPGQEGILSGFRVRHHEKGNIIKSDIVVLEQNGAEVTGTIRRKVPGEQGHRRWSLSGKVLDRTFLAIFWSDNPGIASHGCWYLEPTNDSLLTGYYLKMEGAGKKPVAPIRIDLLRTREPA
ncbi:MAG: hypothetical protein P1S46_01410 [bacterium]|nr:hypothetical protein [bacterium]MDT8394933.1 hypothetical protein [bacterium]